jgi:membrane protein DedA with SNARE-associated domain
MGAAIPLTLGYVFGATWEAVGDILSAFSGFAFAFLSAIVLAALLVRSVQRSKEATLVKNRRAATMLITPQKDTEKR